MSTILPKEPIITDRESVILSNAERKHLRRKFRGTVEATRKILAPRNQLNRFFARKTAEATRVAGDAAQIVKKNAPLIGAIGVGALIYAARRPISDWISRLLKSKTNTPDGD
jgi:hypothetical protein